MKLAARLATLCLVLACTFVLSAQAATLKADVPGPVVIGDQVFPGGTLQIVDVGQSGLVAVRLDGRQVALAFRESGTVSRAASRLVLLVDQRGFYHLSRLAAKDDWSRGLQFAVVERGVATIRPRPAAPATTADEATASN